jgi:ubiquinone/menaquinone biosynthesis C-methylase UbiE
MSGPEVECPDSLPPDSEAKMKREMLELSLPYVVEGALLPPLGVPIDFISESSDRVLARFGFSKVDLENINVAIQRDFFPIPSVRNREGYGGGNFVYWLFGFQDYLKVIDALAKYDIISRRMLDFGGSTGRAFRHFRAQGGVGEVWACDFKKISVQWCKEHYGTSVNVFLSTVVPSLPIEDDYFDLITAFSVFTHIDELEDAWLLELRRILKPGGLLYLTVHDENTWRVMSDLLRDRVRDTPEGMGLDFGAPVMPFDRKSFRRSDAPHYQCNVFRSKSYITRYWGRFVRILDIIENGHAAHSVGQSVVLATKSNADHTGR